MPTLQELKTKLTSELEVQQQRFAEARKPDVSDERKHFILEEFHRAEPELKALRDQIDTEQTLEETSRRNEADLERLREDAKIDRKVAFSSRDAAKTAQEFGAGSKHELQNKGLAEHIWDSEALKSFRDSKGTRARGVTLDAFKSLEEALYSGDGGSEAYEAMIDANIKAMPAPLQAAMKATYTSASLTAYQRPAGMILQGLQMPHVAELIPQGDTDSPTIRYAREVSFVPAATAVAEGALKPEATWNVGEVDAPVRKIAVRARLTEELLEDFPAFRSYVNQRLPLMVQIEEDNQLLNGNGTAPNLRGILQTSGILVHTQGFEVDETTAVTGDSRVDAILRGMTRVQAESYFMPTAHVLNPFDWMEIRLMRSGTGDGAGGVNRGLYLFGNPSDPGLVTLWGLPIVATTRIAAGTALSGAFNIGAMIFRRRGLSVEMTNTNEDDFNKNLISMRAEQREALAVFLPQAFVKTVFA